MSELITLTPAEQFLADQNITMTLKEVADKYGKSHDDLKSALNLAISKLPERSISYVQIIPVQVEAINDKDAKEIINTLILDIRTMLWLMTKFDHEIRDRIVNFAFEKLRKEEDLAIIEARKPKRYKDGSASIRRCLLDAYSDDEELPKEDDVWNALISRGIIETKAKVSIVRRLTPEFEDIVGTSKKHGMPAFYEPSFIREIVEEWEESGKPKKSEYERLQEEFEEISKYYSEKLAEAQS
jgi:hypothetical protein